MNSPQAAKEKCEYCGRFGARKLKQPANHPQAVDGYLTVYLCNRCAGRAEIERQLQKSKEELQLLNAVAHCGDRTSALGRAHLEQRIQNLEKSLK